MPDEYSSALDVLKKYGGAMPAGQGAGFKPPAPEAPAVATEPLASPVAPQTPEYGNALSVLQKYGGAMPAPPPAATQDVKPPVAPVQPPQPAAPQQVQSGIPPSAPGAPAGGPSPVGVKPSAPATLPEALAPSPAAKPSTEPSWAIQALASVTKFPAEIMHGFLRGGEQLLDIPRRIIQNDWESPTPKTISPWAGKAAEAAKALEPKEMNATKFVGNLLGGLAGFAIPGFATAAAGYELPFLGATLLQKFGSNLLTFGFANSMSGLCKKYA